MKTHAPILALLAALLAPCALVAAPPTHFDLSAVFLPAAKPGSDAAIAVTFLPRDPQIRVNEEPTPRLKLDAAQGVLVDRQPARDAGAAPAFDPATARSLDPMVPVRFPVALAPSAPKGTHAVKASVTYFYCSKKDGWCRKGTTDIEVTVRVP
jgi:hypothetical protein